MNNHKPKNNITSHVLQQSNTQQAQLNTSTHTQRFHVNLPNVLKKHLYPDVIELHFFRVKKLHLFLSKIALSHKRGLNVSSYASRMIATHSLCSFCFPRKGRRGEIRRRNGSDTREEPFRVSHKGTKSTTRRSLQHLPFSMAFPSLWGHFQLTPPTLHSRWILPPPLGLAWYSTRGLERTKKR